MSISFYSVFQKPGMTHRHWYPMTMWVTTNSCSGSYPTLAPASCIAFWAHPLLLHGNPYILVFFSFLIWRASQNLLHCVSSQMLLGVFVMYSACTKCTNPKTEWNSWGEKIETSVSILESMFPTLALWKCLFRAMLTTVLLKPEAL